MKGLLQLAGLSKHAYIAYNARFRSMHTQRPISIKNANLSPIWSGKMKNARLSPTEATGPDRARPLVVHLNREPVQYIVPEQLNVY